ncbi:MAG: GDSL family lipase [Firmicutes bacterium HGW-Firmicutes-21]|nr:MAG: GDSL family lipase [Firmicutes bacterium HGW-Firmicutes-21]
MRILFQGDSITDSKRIREDFNNLGQGYAKYAAEEISRAFPDRQFEFINRGISGDKAESLKARWQSDCIDLRPDVVSILLGVNDTWHFAETDAWMPNEYFENCYRDILTQVKTKTNAKIIILEQFLLYTPDKAYFRIDLNPKIDITRALAREFADVFVPLDGIFAAASVGREPTFWADDGVHPTEEGAKLIAKHYVEAFKTVL